MGQSPFWHPVNPGTTDTLGKHGYHLAQRIPRDNTDTLGIFLDTSGRMDTYGKNGYLWETLDVAKPTWAADRLVLQHLWDG